MDLTIQDITIYNKIVDEGQIRWRKSNLKGTYRNTSILNRTTTGVTTNDTAVLRLFDTSDYVDEHSFKNEAKKGKWTIQIDDIVVGKFIDDELTGTSPVTTLQNKYGKSLVQKVVSFDDFRKGVSLSHIKIGLK